MRFTIRIYALTATFSAPHTASHTSWLLFAGLSLFCIVQNLLEQVIMQTRQCNFETDQTICMQSIYGFLICDGKAVASVSFTMSSCRVCQREIDPILCASQGTHTSEHCGRRSRSVMDVRLHGAVSLLACGHLVDFASLAHLDGLPCCRCSKAQLGVT